MVYSEIKKFSNANEFVEIISTITENDYFTIGEQNVNVCICNNSYKNCDNDKVYSFSDLWQIAKDANDLVIERNYYLNN